MAGGFRLISYITTTPGQPFIGGQMAHFFAATVVSEGSDKTVYGGLPFQAENEAWNLRKVIELCDAPPGFHDYDFVQWTMDDDFALSLKHSHLACIIAKGNKMMKDYMYFGHKGRIQSSFILGLGDGKTRDIWPFHSQQACMKAMDLFASKQKIWEDFQTLLAKKAKKMAEDYDSIDESQFRSFNSFDEMINHYKK